MMSIKTYFTIIEQKYWGLKLLSMGQNTIVCTCQNKTKIMFIYFFGKEYTENEYIILWRHSYSVDNITS